MHPKLPFLTKYNKNITKCKNCGFCAQLIWCPSPNYCIGCAACYRGCPYEAIEAKSIEETRQIQIYIDNKPLKVSYGITIKQALEDTGITFTGFPEANSLFAPCETGGCHSCVVLANGIIVPACHTPIQEQMFIETKLPPNYTPRRIIEGFSPHSVGGVGTPWHLKTTRRYIEVAAFAAGCNFRCRMCQNYSITYRSRGEGITPESAAIQLTSARRRHQVDRMAISGGESTLNQSWLISFFKKLSFLNPDKDAHIHLDTNGSILTYDYIDELVEAGMTDIGPDLKAVRLATFLKITCLSNKELAKRYLETAWNAVKYIADTYYPDQLFMGVGLPYNQYFYLDPEQRLEELQEWAERLCNINDSIQVCVLDYRPEFRAVGTSFQYPNVEEIKQIKKLLEEVGLKRVIAQTKNGHLGPND